ncbi:hypothetical protein DMC14_001715 [Metamycoplasma phocicerebrale]|uniref:Uncharacterized protein n=1 Tax=Metamycoplasma phocicerebrale TaxID=142649 RepID=A0A3Q9V336_9BACT|nr:hypothetical protein [Metamycoplasma phocicerebrale]AZZ65501.1 hypothetical protein DMC14_001715 [Metamycoplasma phocicerebrale]
MFLYNTVQREYKEDNKQYEYYNEDINAKIIALKDNNGKKVTNKSLKNNSLEVSILRNLSNNCWIIDISIETKAYDNSRFKFIKINNKEILLEQKEHIKNKYKFRINKFKDGTFIKFENLKELMFAFYSKYRKYQFWNIGFKINFKINKNNMNFSNLNVRNKNLKFKLIESINFNIKEDSISSIDPFENNTGYINNLYYNFRFYNIKQNQLVHKVIEQDLELKTQNKYYIPDREFQLEFLNKVNINDSINNKDYKLLKQITRLNPFKYNIKYYIDNPCVWDNDKKEFKTAIKSKLNGYHIPLNHLGKLEFKYKIEQSMINNFNEIKYNDFFENKLFDYENGLIKLNVDAIKTTKEYQDLYYDNWQTKIL